MAKDPNARRVSLSAMWGAAGVLGGAVVLAFFVNGWGGSALAALASAYDAVSPGAVTYSRSDPSSDPGKPPAPEPTQLAAAHLPTPVPLKAIYMTQCVVGTPSFREELVKLLDETELNAVVIDIRDFSGGIAFPTDNPMLKDMVSDKCGARDMEAFIKKLHDKHIYVIGRITTFQNPLYTRMHPEQAVQKTGGGVWKDNKGLAFVDVGATEYWKTVAELAKESYAIGFDEINFDYIRYPSDGPMKEAEFIKRDGKNKQEMLEDFFKYLHDELKPTGVVMSADLFGMVTTNYDDLNIGQVLERALPYFDYIAPMVYPSHYPKTFNGWPDPNKVPGELIKFVMDSAVRRTISTTSSIPSLAYERIGTSTPAVYSKPAYDAKKMRPWLQDFDYPVEYTPAMVEAQIKSNEAAGLDSYMFWDPSNKYSSLRQILKTE